MGGSGSKQPQGCIKGCDTAYVQERQIIESVKAAVAKTGDALLGPVFEDKDAYAGCVKGCDTAFVQGKPHNISDRQQAVDALGEGTIEALEIVERVLQIVTNVVDWASKVPRTIPTLFRRPPPLSIDTDNTFEGLGLFEMLGVNEAVPPFNQIWKTPRRGQTWRALGLPVRDRWGYLQ